jgi:23S rRNA pseudouridine2605 synthase
MPAERLQKVMAAAGIASRRACEELIVAGRVQVNGKVVTELGAKADPKRDRIVVDGKPLLVARQHLYFRVHKPRGVLSDIGGDAGERRTVADLLPEGTPRVFPVGRLDLHSEGLVLLTDDGELANRLTHPRYQHPKTYFVLVEARPQPAELDQLRAGVELPEGRSAPAEVTLAERLPLELKLSKGPTVGVWLRIVLREGKKRQVRHMTAAIGYPTLRLVRWSIGPLTLSGLELGECEPLTPGEIGALRRMAGLAEATPAGGAAAKGKPKPPGRPRTGAARAAGPKSTPGRKKPSAQAEFERKSSSRTGKPTSGRAPARKPGRTPGKKPGHG